MATQPLPKAGEIRFVLDGEVVNVADVDPTTTVLQYLRETLRRTGTKEGCAEGDCGACTVVVAEPIGDDRLTLRAINSCIQFLPTLDGKQLITVESLSPPGGPLHPVQRAMVECHGSQCGFCTPGFVMSLFALYKSHADPTRRRIDDTLAGNLCRCTGYRPIVTAAQKMCALETEADRSTWIGRACANGRGVTDEERELAALLRSIRRTDALSIEHGGRRFFAPTEVDQLTLLANEYPQACLLAGGTDVGLWVTKQLRELDTVIYVGNVAQLKRIGVEGGHIEIGSAVSLTDAMTVLLEHYPELTELFTRFASPPIRNAGTLGGNIANGSPIGDTMPALLALDATLVLRDALSRREVPLDRFYIDYQKNARRPGEILERIRVPLPRPGMRVRSYKVSKRFDQDISAVCGAYRVELDGERVSEVRIAYGGVAAIPKRASEAEQALQDKPWNEASVRRAMAALDRDFEPITDMRASRDYRSLVTRNLLYKFYLDTSDEPPAPRVYDYAR